MIRIDRPDDPRIAGFRDIRERDLTGRQGLFVAEGEVVLNVLTSPPSLCRPVALLLDQKRAEGLAGLIGRVDPDAPVYVADQAILDAIAGFHLHRGILALGRKPDPLTMTQVLAPPGEDAVRGRGLRDRQSRQYGRACSETPRRSEPGPCCWIGPAAIPSTVRPSGCRSGRY